MATSQLPLATSIGWFSGDCQPLIWGRDPFPVGTLAEWQSMPGLYNDAFEYVFNADINALNESMSVGNEVGKDMLIRNERAFRELTIQELPSEAAAAQTRANPFTRLAMTNRVTEEGMVRGSGARAGASAGARAGGRGRAKKTCSAVVPYRGTGGSITASPIQGSGARFSFH